MSDLSRKDQLMLVDYQSCLATIRHEDGRKSHLFSVFLVLHGVLFGFYSSIMDRNRLGSISIAVLALGLSLLWFLAMERMRAFVDLRYVQAEQLEKKLKDITTIRIELALRNTGIARVHDGEVKLNFHQRLFSVSKHLEILLPVLTAGIWIVFILISGLS